MSELFFFLNPKSPDILLVSAESQDEAIKVVADMTGESFRDDWSEEAMIKMIKETYRIGRPAVSQKREGEWWNIPDSNMVNIEDGLILSLLPHNASRVLI